MAEIQSDEDRVILTQIVGVGSVGCKIISRIDNLNSSCVGEMYFNESKDLLNSYTTSTEEQYHLQGSLHLLEKKFRDNIKGKDVVFIVAGLGGATGSEIAPHLARIVKEMDILCVGLFSFPFEFEGRAKKLKAYQAYTSIHEFTDSFVCIDNDSFLEEGVKNKLALSKNDFFLDSNAHFYAVINSLLHATSEGATIKANFDDIKNLFKNMGLSTVGYSLKRGEERVENAVKALLASPAIKKFDFSIAKKCLITISSDLGFAWDEYEKVGDAARELLPENVEIIIAVLIDPELVGSFELTIIITGLPELPIDESVKNDSLDIVRLFRAISFEPHQASAGLSILSYFNEFLQQKYSGTEANVLIEQTANKVNLIIETPSGEIERIEKSLNEFGLVVKGEKEPYEVLDNRLDIERLKMKLEIASLELRQTEKILILYECENTINKQKVGRLEDQMAELQKVICNSLVTSQQQLSMQLVSYTDIPNNLIQLIDENLTKEVSDNSKILIEDEIIKNSNNPKAMLSLREFIENSLYGVAGNSLYSFLVHVLNSLPK